MKSGIALKTFIFALLLMTSVMFVTLGILYAFMPGYYFRHIVRQLDRNTTAFIETLGQDSDAEHTRQLIFNFASANNVSVMPLDDEYNFLIHLSNVPIVSPRITLQEIESLYFGFDFIEFDYQFITDIDEFPFHILPREAGFRIPDELGFFISPFLLSAEIEVQNIVPMFGDTNDSQNIIAFMRPVEHPEISHLIITSTLQPIDQAQIVLLAMLPYLAAAGFVVALIMAFIFSKRLTRPIIKISEATVQMREMKPDAFSGINSNDELGNLSRNLDKLYQDLCTNIKDLQVEVTKTAKLEQSKTDFMRAAGHELKTPIAALSGMLDGMIDQVGAYKDRETYLPELKSQTDRLTRLVNEILKASKSDSISEDLEVTSVSIDELIEETVLQYKPFIEQKNLKLGITHSNGYCLDTDRRLLLITLSNLMSNAVKYTPDGGCINIAADNKTFSIENECTPIDPDLLPKWFEPFYTPDYSRDKRESGTGLGLYIVKKNLEALEFPLETVITTNGIRFEVTFI